MTFDDLRRRVIDFMERAFVPREVFFRSGDRFHHFPVSVRLQKLFAGLGAVFTLWVLFTSVSYVVHNVTLIAKQEEIERQKLAYFDLLAEVSDYHNQFAKITKDMEGNQAYLLSLLEKNPENKKKLAKIQRQLKDSTTEHARVVIAREGLRDKMQQFENDLLQIADRNISLRSQVGQMKELLHSSEAQRDEVAVARAQLVKRLGQVENELNTVSSEKQGLELTVAGLRAELTSSEKSREGLQSEKSNLNKKVAGLEQQLGDTRATQAELESRISTLNTTLAQATDLGEQLEDQRTFLERRVGGLEQRLVDLRDAEKNVIERLSERAKLSIDMVEKTVEMTGLDVGKMIASANREELGRGGPFVPASDEAAEFEPSLQLEATVTMLDERLDRWTALQEIVRRLPLSAPLDQYRIASSYGARKDPVNGRKAQHQGVDFAAPMSSSVFATAPGKVVFAGWRGRYGRTIEIDHGYGIRTRFAHLRKILVKVGDEVDNRQKIGLLGSSGRSTGPHVHYEVHYKGKTRNPMKFMKAGKHVFKG